MYTELQVFGSVWLWVEAEAHAAGRFKRALRLQNWEIAPKVEITVSYLHTQETHSDISIYLEL